VAEARASLYPRISLTASGGTSSEELVHLLDGRFWVWSFFANLMQPVFQGGRLVAQVDLAEANLEETTANFLKTTLGAYAEVETSLAALEHLGRQVEALERATEEAEQAERIARERYAAGLDGPNTLLDAQRASLLAASQLLQTRRERLDARINLHLALGGGFEEEW
jgi:outer membrane protein TolC